MLVLRDLPDRHVSDPNGTVSLRVEVTEGVGGVSPAEWGRLFCGHPDTYENVALSQRCGMDGITFRTVIIRDESGPVLVVPTFEAAFRASTMADGAARRVVRRLEPVIPGVFRPRLLGIGLVECEWGAIGVRPGCATATLQAAWSAAKSQVDALARQRRSNAIVLLELGPATMDRLPSDVLRRFAPVQTSPCAQVPLPFRTVDEYLKGLSRSTRQGLRRRVRASAHLRIERVSNPTPYRERIAELYRQTVSRAPVVLGVQRPSYFERVCSEVPGAHFVLYFAGDTLLAFNLLISRPDMLIDKYFCMDPERGRQHHLYFVSWMENIRHAIEHGCPVYHAGPGAEETKSHLGCRFIRTSTLFRHTNPAAHAVLSFLARTVGRESKAKERPSAIQPGPVPAEVAG